MANNMKILKIIHGYPPEYYAGSEVYSQSICNELSKSHEVIIFSREENEYAPDFEFRETFTETGIKHIRVNMARGKDGYNHPLLNTKFKQFVEHLKPDVAHVGHLNHLSIGIIDVLHELKIPILFTLHDFWLMCPRGQFLQRNFDGYHLFNLCDKQNDIKCATSCYSMYFSGIENPFDSALSYMDSLKPPYSYMDEANHWQNWIGERMKQTRAIIEKVDMFHAPSKYLMNRFIDNFSVPSKKIFYLDYGFPLNYLKPVTKANTNRYTFGYIGTHIPAKGINMLIEAFCELKGMVALKIFGRTNGQNTNALRKMSEKSSNPISFEGEYLNHDLAERVFSVLDCIVVPSIWAENSPLVIHEAQACRIPVITANYGGMSEYVKHRVNGLLFNHRDVKSLSEQMAFAMDNPELMSGLGKKGYLYSYDGNVPDIVNHTKQLERTYQKLMSNGQ
jgi:glycosyltransferase involved in cell wall biosynthesis